MKMDIVHVAAHLGAGAGKAIAGIAVSDRKNRHRIVLLEQPEKRNHVDYCRRHGIEVHICPSNIAFRRLAENASVLIVNWWHHPALFKILAPLSEIPSRLVLWSHVNGLHYPVLAERFAGLFDACMFTSEASFSSQHWSEAFRREIRRNSSVVYGMGDFSPERIPPKQGYRLHSPVRLGYVGSLDYAKMSPDFLGWCRELLVCDGMQLILAGDLLPRVASDIERMGLSDRVALLGFREDVPAILSSLDVFVYLLNPQNFATTENALLEAMAAGLPVVVSDGAAEKAIVSDGVDGLVVGSVDACVAKIRKLVTDDGLREKIGRKARATAMKRCDTKRNAEKFTSIMDKVMRMEKHSHDFVEALGMEPFSWFLSGCGREAAEFFRRATDRGLVDGEWHDLCRKAHTLGEIFRGNSKGSVFQFSRAFPEDAHLARLCRLYETI